MRELDPNDFLVPCSPPSRFDPVVNAAHVVEWLGRLNSEIFQFSRVGLC